MEIYQNFNEDDISEKISRIKNSIYKEIKDKLKTKRFEANMMQMLSEIWDLKKLITLKTLIVNLNFNLRENRNLQYFQVDKRFGRKR